MIRKGLIFKYGYESVGDVVMIYEIGDAISKRKHMLTCYREDSPLHRRTFALENNIIKDMYKARIKD